MYKFSSHPQFKSSSSSAYKINSASLLTITRPRLSLQHVLFSSHYRKWCSHRHLWLSAPCLRLYRQHKDREVSVFTRDTSVAIQWSLSLVSLPSFYPPVYSSHLYQTSTNIISVKGYNNTELTFAVNKTNVVPPLNTIQLLNVLYRCVDTKGDIAANSFCIAGCSSIGDLTVSDECAM